MTISHVNGTTTTHYYVMTNSRGDVEYIYNTSGTLVAQYTYDAWGNVLTIKDGSGAAITSTSHIGYMNPIRYRGYYYDVESGMYYILSRYYDAEVGRWLNADVYISTGQSVQGYNMFAYCNNNPVIYIDRDGKDFALAAGWASTMWWLCAVDGPLPVGEIVYVSMAVILTAIAIVVYLEYKPEIVWDEQYDDNIPSPNNDDSISSSNNDDSIDSDYEEDDYGYGDEYTTREKIGKSKGKTPRDNKRQNEQFNDATRGLTKDQKRYLHDKNSGGGLGYHDYKELAKDFFYFVFGFLGFEEDE